MTIAPAVSLHAIWTTFREKILGSACVCIDICKEVLTNEHESCVQWPGETTVTLSPHIVTSWSPVTTQYLVTSYNIISRPLLWSFEFKQLSNSPPFVSSLCINIYQVPISQQIETSVHINSLQNSSSRRRIYRQSSVRKWCFNMFRRSFLSQHLVRKILKYIILFSPFHNWWSISPVKGFHGCLGLSIVPLDLFLAGTCNGW